MTLVSIDLDHSAVIGVCGFKVCYLGSVHANSAQVSSACPSHNPCIFCFKKLKQF